MQLRLPKLRKFFFIVKKQEYSSDIMEESELLISTDVDVREKK